MSPTPFYLDWTFWSFVVAALAILLSQLPPVRQWSSKAQVEVDVYGRMIIDHLLGYPNIGAVVGIRNVGGRGARVHGVTIAITKGGNLLGTVRGDSYYTTPQAKESVIFTPFAAPPGHEWVHTIHFLERLSQTDNRELGQLRADVRLDIGNKVRERNEADPDSQQMVEASDALLQRMSTVFNQRFIWTAGEYEVELQVMADDKPAGRRRYRFTLYESDVQQLRDDFERYRFGWVVALDDPNRRFVFVDLSPVV